MKAFRVFVSLAIIVAIFWWVGAGEAVSAFGQLDWFYLTVVILYSVILIAASSAKWQVFARAMGYDASLWRLMKLYSMGYFFNMFAPASVAGDVMRSLHLDEKGDRRGDAILATFLERLTGFLAMTLLGAMAVIVGTNAASGLELVVLLVAVGTIAGTACCVVTPLRQRMIDTFRFVARKIFSDRVSKKVNSLCEKIEQAMLQARKSPYLLTKGILWSIVFHVLGTFNVYICGKAIGWQTPPVLELMVVIPLILIIGSIPITPSGVGLQEGAFVFFLERIGATKAQALAVAIILRAKVLLIAILGGIFWYYLRKKGREKAEESHSSLTLSK